MNNLVKNFRVGMAGLIGSTLLLSGCATDSAATAGLPKVSNTVAQACLTGALVGLGLRALGNDDADLGDYALAAAGGALAGCAVGAILDNRRADFASDAEYYDSEIARTRNLNSEVMAVNASLENIIRENQTQLASLKSQAAASGEDREAARALRNTSKAQLSYAKQQLDNAEKELGAQKVVLATAEKAASDASRVAALRSQVAQLESTVSNLKTQVASLTAVNDSIGQFAA